MLDDKEKAFDYINVIPLVDVMLVLLTIVLTTSAFIASGTIPMELPRASKNHETLRTQTIEIDRKGAIYYNSTPVTIDELKDSIKNLDRSVPVLIRADREIALQVFVDVLDTVKRLDFRKVNLQTQERR
jgi:biopolymer transport protein ExbD